MTAAQFLDNHMGGKYMMIHCGKIKIPMSTHDYVIVATRSSFKHMAVASMMMLFDQMNPLIPGVEARMAAVRVQLAQASPAWTFSSRPLT